MKNTGRHPVLFIVLDAFRHDYLDPERTPALMDAAARGLHVRQLRPNFGFCERTEMFTGTTPDINGLFTALTLSSGGIFASNTTDIALLGLLDWETVFLRRFTRRFFRDWFRKVRHIRQPVYEIPLALLPRVVLTEDRRELHMSGWSEIETIFDVLRRENRTFFFDTFASLTMDIIPEHARDDCLVRALREKPADFYLLYIGDGDGTGHDFGPHSPEAREMNRRVDARFRHVSEAFFREHPAGSLLVIGDHGMLPVERTIKPRPIIREAARRTGLRPVRDYDLFLDSTMIRLWMKTDAARRVFSELFAIHPEFSAHGRLLTRELAADLHVPPPGSGYGDLLWIASPGVLVFPDYFHYRHPCRGMHGYETHVSGQKGFAIALGERVAPGVLDEKELIDVCPTLCHLLDISVPAHNQGKGFFSS